VTADWRILATTGQIVCPECLTNDDKVANLAPQVWIDQAGVTRIGCRCGADLGPVPETKPTDVECKSCGMVATYAGETGDTLWVKKLPPLD
jgi:hypothetical protein